MKAVAVVEKKSLEQGGGFAAIDLPDPVPEPHDLLIRVRAVGVNPVDYKQRRMWMPEHGPRVLGFDGAGVVAATGPECGKFRVGDEVYWAGSVVRPGSNATLQCVDERIVGRKPKALSFAEAAALPLTALTAWESLFERLGLTPEPAAHAGEAVLVIGGAGGVGSIAIQLLRALTAATAVATAARPETAAWCRSMGAHQVVNHRGDLVAEVRALGIKQVLAVLNTADTDGHHAASCELVGPLGGVCCIVDAAGPLDLNPLKKKSARFCWEFMFTRAVYRTLDMARQGEILDRVSEMLDAGALRTTLTDNLGPLTPANLAAAHRQLETGRTLGKLALEVE